MLDEILDAVTDALEDAGLSVVMNYPLDRLCDNFEGVVCVGLKSSEITSAGSGGYIGEKTNADGSISELYAVRAENVVSMDIYEPMESGVQGCLETFEKISAAVGQLSDGLRVGTLVCCSAEPDEYTGMMHCPVEMHCTAYLIAEADEDSDEFTDFVLRGVLNNG